MGSWQLQEAKAKLSEVIATAKKQGPQIITQRGVTTAVVIPFDEWERNQISATKSAGNSSVWPQGRSSHPPSQSLEDERAGGVLKSLLDTNILSEIQKTRPHGSVLAWFTANHSAGLATPAIALFEMQMP